MKKKTDSTYFKTTYQQIQVSTLLKACIDEVTENGTESHISQRRELYFKGRNHMHGWCKGKVLQMGKVICQAIVIGQGTK